MSFLINPFAFAVAGGDFESIATVTVGSGGAADIEFTSIPSGFQHLQIRMIVRDSRSGVELNNASTRINGDTGSNYAYHALIGSGSSASANGSTSQSELLVALATSATATASVFGAAVIDILDYASTTKYKTFRALQGYDNNGSGTIRLRSALWMSTSAITSIKFSPSTSGSFVEHTTAALYGVKAP